MSIESKGLKMNEKKELSQKSRNRIFAGAWILISLQVMVLLGFVIDRQERDPAIEAFLRKPTPAAIGGTLGYLIGTNMLPLVALIAGLTLWRHGKTTENKTIIIASVAAIIVSSMLAIW
jgi:hypothetical protein